MKEELVKIGVVIGLHGAPGRTPTWLQVRDEVRAAEAVGFDTAVVEDALLYRDDDGVVGYWESVSIAGAICAATSRIEVGHSVINAPYRSAAIIAKIAETLDEIAGGRFILGIGLGNTMDYEQFGVPADQRFARFAEAIQIVHALLRTGRADFDGRHQFARGAELLPRGPRPQGPPIVIAARGPKMMDLAARYADGWNWWSAGPPDLAELSNLLRELDRRCATADRDPSTLRRSLDVYSVDPLGLGPADEVIAGDPDRIAGALLELAALGFEEVRCNLAGESANDRLRSIEAMAGVVTALHADAGSAAVAVRPS
jgi:alkanesulfonate monooxygenase SsuD/methylene tetrahydromethanopterin reductase-like flavin-dependent oxidoreductase (luciferase family)